MLVGFKSIPEIVLEQLRCRQEFLILGHEKPDADCLSSQLALHSLLQRLGKRSWLCSRGPFERVEIMELSDLFSAEIDPQIKAAQPLVIVLDCGDIGRTGFAEQLDGLEVLVIDHHANGQHLGKYLYIDSFSPSTTLLIQRLIEALAAPVTAAEAEHIFLGFATDTGYFRFLEQKHGEVFPLIGRLLDAGVAPRDLHRMLAGNQPFSTRMLLGKLLLRTRSYLEERVRICYELEDDLSNEQLERDSPRLYDLLLSSADTEVVILLRQSTDGWHTSFRSHNCDVGQLAANFGGGGHRHAAGCRFSELDVERVIEQLVAATAVALA